MREAFNPYSVLELTAGDVGEVSYASTFGFWILVIRREIVIIRRVIVMIRRGNMKFLTSLSGENPGSGDRPLLSHGLKGDAGNRTNFKQLQQRQHGHNKYADVLNNLYNHPCCSFIMSSPCNDFSKCIDHRSAWLMELTKAPCLLREGWILTLPTSPGLQAIF